MTNKDGFTLIEFMVATVVLMVGLLGMLQAINIAMTRNLESVFRNEATALADERLMLKKASPFLSISTTTANPPSTPVTRNVRGIFKNYSVQQIVTARSSLSKEIVINVAWRNRGTRYSHSISSAVSTFPQ